MNFSTVFCPEVSICYKTWKTWGSRRESKSLKRNLQNVLKIWQNSPSFDVLTTKGREWKSGKNFTVKDYVNTKLEFAVLH